MDSCQKRGILLSYPTFHEGCGEVGQQYSVCTTLGDDTLSHIPGGVEIEVRCTANEGVTPVGIPHGDIPSGGVFQVPMSAEMNEGIGLKPFLHIEIRCQITVRGSHLYTMHQPEVIISQGWSWLGE